MRVGYVLLGLVTLTSVHISIGQTCSNDLPGLQNGNVCCPAACGTCGGVGCAQRPGGADSCCVGTITDDCMMCSETMAAPCIIDTCNNGLQGIQNVEQIGDLDVCCDGACGECGGEFCSTRPGGAANCCRGRIETSRVTCSTMLAAPCIIDNPVVCSDGTHGIEANGACCEAQCGTCGGVFCSQRPGGKDSCCTQVIQSSGIFCDVTMKAPCIVMPFPLP